MRKKEKKEEKEEAKKKKARSRKGGENPCPDAASSENPDARVQKVHVCDIAVEAGRVVDLDGLHLPFCQDCILAL